MTKPQAIAASIGFALVALGVSLHAPEKMTLKQVFAAANPLKTKSADAHCTNTAARILCDHVYKLRTTKRPDYKAGEIATDYRRYIP